MITRIEFKLNDEWIRLSVDSERTLLWVLRSDLGLTGTKYGCGIGACGACTVLLGGEPAVTCMGALVANAIFDATGVRFYELPISPERIQEALKMHAVQRK